jgi:hypothetical protein
MPTIRVAPAQKRTLTPAQWVLSRERLRRLAQGETVEALAEPFLRLVAWVPEPQRPVLAPGEIDPFFDMLIGFDGFEGNAARDHDEILCGAYRPRRRSPGAPPRPKVEAKE